MYVSINSKCQKKNTICLPFLSTNHPFSQSIGNQCYQFLGYSFTETYYFFIQTHTPHIPLTQIYTFIFFITKHEVYTLKSF